MQCLRTVHQLLRDNKYRTAAPMKVSLEKIILQHQESSMDFLRNAMYNGKEEIVRQKNNRGFMLYTAFLFSTI